MTSPSGTAGARIAAMPDTFLCGPLQIQLSTDNALLHAKVAETLALYDVPWDAPHSRVGIDVRWSSARASMISGSLLVCARMRVEVTESGLYATATSGSTARFSAPGEHWLISVPRSTAAVPEDVEDLIGLAITTSWRRLGWVPLHAAAVARDDCGAILCAPSGGGKTTLAAALLRRGWRTLGDDKLLLRLIGGRPEIAALVESCNLHPRDSPMVSGGG